MNRRMGLLTTLALWLLAAVAQAGTVTYVYTDPQGTPLAEANASGAITARFDYAPYGQSVTSMGAAPNGPGYTGHVNDPDTGLVYMQARYYDPAVGRFLSVDPVGPAAGKLFGFNRYNYVSNNPILNIDPDGRQDIPMVSITLRDGSKINVPSNYAQNTIMADATQSSSSDYANPSFDNVKGASALDNVQLAGTATALATITDVPQVAVVAGGVAEVSGALAFFMDPTLERFVNVLTVGGFRALKMSARGSSEALKTVEQLQKSDDATDILTAVQQQQAQQQKQRQQEEQKQKQQRHPNDKFIGS